MYIYYFIFIYFICITFLDASKIQRRDFYHSLIYLFTFLLLWIILSIRWECLTDWYPYHDFYVHKIKFSLSTEVGYVKLVELMRSISNNFTFFLFVINFITLFFFFHTIKKLTDYSLIALLFFYVNFFFVFGGMRQLIAISIICFSVQYIIERNFLRFLIIVLIASLFHYTAIAFILAYFFATKRFKTSYLLLFLIAILILNYFAVFQNLFLFLLGKTLNSNIFADKIIEYQKSVEQINILTYIKRLSFPLIYLLLRPYVETKSPKYNIFFNIYFLSSILFFIFIGSLDVVAIRGSIYFNLGEMFLFPLLLKVVIDDPKQKYLMISILVLISLTKLTIALNQVGISEYKTIFTK